MKHPNFKWSAIKSSVHIKWNISRRFNKIKSAIFETFHLIFFSKLLITPIYFRIYYSLILYSLITISQLWELKVWKGNRKKNPILIFGIFWMLCISKTGAVVRFNIVRILARQQACLYVSDHCVREQDFTLVGVIAQIMYHFLVIV